MSMPKLWPMPGGIHPSERKALSNREPIAQPPLPARLIVPLGQHIGVPARPLVGVGAPVLKGQKIAEAADARGLPVHAPTSGTVVAIGPQSYPHASGPPAEAIVIDSDGLDRWVPLAPSGDYRSLSREALLALIRDAGIAGLGGAGFPTAAKLATGSRIATLVINGAECEPYITADDRLMRERARELVAGIEILAHLLGPERVLIGIEDNKPEAIGAVSEAVAGTPFMVVSVPTLYPSGGEKQLIQILTGLEVPSGGLPADIGVLCQNVGTCVAVHDAVLLGRPLISRITTLTGEALQRPMNVEALVGTPIKDLLAFAGLDERRLGRLLVGGPMMGFSLADAAAPVIKTSNCLLAATPEELPAPPPAMPCIRCGDCAEACPASLLPQQLLFYAQGEDHEQLQAHNLFDCIECGACAYVCPSSIPLVQHYRAAKAQLREQADRQARAEQARLRFEARQERLRQAEARKEAERQARAEKAERMRAAQAEAPADDPLARLQAKKAGVGDEVKKLKIEASMAQVALKKAEKQLAAHDTPELQAQVETLRRAAEQARQALDEAQAKQAAEPAATPTAAPDLKKIKIEAAMLRAQIGKLERLELPDNAERAELERLRTALGTAEAQLRALEEQAQPAPAAAPNDDLKRAKIALALKRAELKKAEKTGADDEELAPLRAALVEAEQALHRAEAASGRPAPEHVLIDKRPVSAEERARKTERAYARAELHKLERDPAASPEALVAARERLARAEQALAAQPLDS
ncbi:electron transport complex subunit RsxC [Stutzerimonas azotifigens]|uniref:electron transport complex subunit RsxC n=1 Tax=Stutzerimonas azotifigens TaxID=291995 RepID=UPI0003F57416|nr:electron transport complex subunit RsxC [Stutzerimonas azotifigens]